MEGASGGKETNFGSTGKPGVGGEIEDAIIDLSSYDTLEIWVGEDGGSDIDHGWGRSNGGEGGGSDRPDDGGGSTEIWTDTNSVFIAAADAGGAAATQYNGNIIAGGGGARGGSGGTGDFPGEDAEEKNGPGNGGDSGNSSNRDGENGGAEINSSLAIDEGTITKGGADEGHGKIKLRFLG